LPFVDRMTKANLPLIPAGFFGFVLGFGGLANAWRVACRVWHVPAVVGEGFVFVAFVVWAVVLVLFTLKWVFVREAALAEANDPIHSGTIALAGVSTMLVAVLVLPYTYGGSVVLCTLGFVAAVLFGAWQTGRYWQGLRRSEATTPIMYLPTVGLGYLSAIALASYGQIAFAQMSFGIGIFTWLAIESILFARLYMEPSMAPVIRPTLGIELAPPALGLVTYLAVTTGPPDWFAHALLGEAIFIGIVLVRLLPWILEQRFTASYWGFTFGITSLAGAPVRMLERGDSLAVGPLAVVIFVVCNIAMLVIIVATLRLIGQGRLIPQRPGITVVASDIPRP
jgi:tellurite resistance protein